MRPVPHFEAPPVREVILTVMFEPVTSLQTLHLAPLRVAWAGEYPKVSEMTPLPPWRLPLDRAQVEIIGSGSNWPVPLCLLTNSAGDRALQVQNDRFVVSWRFDNQAGHYPGYQALLAELRDKFDQLSEVLTQAVGEAPAVGKVEASYRNLLEGIAPQDLTLGIMTAWQKVDASPIVRDAAYIGFRMHYHPDTTDADVSVLIGVDPDAGLSTPKENGNTYMSSTFSIEADCAVSVDQEYAERLTKAHDMLISAFLDLTTEDMRKAWGGSDER